MEEDEEQRQRHQQEPAVEDQIPPSARRLIMIPDSWSQAADSVTYDSSSPPITLVCGPKNSGKTTFSRHLLNALLTRYKTVAYLDTDVGQTEFTTPGCLSLHLINEPSPDLSILTLKTPKRCMFFGDTSSKRDPETYLKNIFYLYDFFCEKYHQPQGPGSVQIPLVINTAGWVKGIGYDVLVGMLRYMAPTHVVQIRISADSKNLPTGAFWLNGDQSGQVNLIEIDAALRNASNSSVLIRKDGRLLRDIRIIAYFRQCLPSDMNITTNKELANALAALPPYEVPISTTKVMHLHCKVPSSEVLHSLNATIVGLAVSSQKPTDSESCAPWCVGLGLVRGIDISKDLFYVITPVPQRNLLSVDTLLQGFIDIPSCLVQVHGCVSPYMAVNVLPSK